MPKQKLIFTNKISEAVMQLADGFAPASVIVITDRNVAAKVLPTLHLPDAWRIISVPPGDESKNLDSLSSIWQMLIDFGATRKSLIFNIGGGVVTDMGGFAAATFKRGVRFVNVPTTLLGAVDAAVGGKTGINFGGLKNEVGAFAPADAVIISTSTFSSLSQKEMLSGYAEMLKHGLLEGSEAYLRLLRFDIARADLDELLRLLEENVRVKERIVEADPFEKGPRRALNLGHTAGHAFESLALESGVPVPHGFAVAWGLLVEMILSHMVLGFESAEVHKFAVYLKAQGYGAPAITCDDYPLLLELMSHDKKNETPESINFTLLHAIGEPRPGCVVGAPDIIAALDIFRDLLQ